MNYFDNSQSYFDSFHLWPWRVWMKCWEQREVVEFTIGHQKGLHFNPSYFFRMLSDAVLYILRLHTPAGILIVSLPLHLVDAEESPLSNCWFLQSERWLQTAVTCSRQSSYKVDSDSRGETGCLNVSLGLLIFVHHLLHNVNTSVRKSPHAGLICGTDVHSTVCCLCYHLLNVCVSLRLFCFKFSDVITGGRLYSDASHGTWLPPSGGNRESAAAHTLWCAL